MSFIECRNVSYSYLQYNDTNNDEYVDVFKDLSLCIKKGSFNAVIGKNASGKSTLARLINAIILPENGEVIVNGLSTNNKDNLWDIRKTVGMVFQNPDSQIISSIVEEDIAFGPENLGLPSDEIRKRVEDALKFTDMQKYRNADTYSLSGGQKQKIAIAGILAMKPDCIVLDEPTAMLEPKGRKQIIEYIKRLNEEEKITIVLITHFMEEAAMADNIIVFGNGEVISETPKNILTNKKRLEKLGLDTTQMVKLKDLLCENGINLKNDIFNVDEMVLALSKFEFENKNNVFENKLVENKNKNIIELKNVSFYYGINTEFENKAVDNVSFNIKEGEFFGIIGHTGSGKSTILQLFNGLLRSYSGKVIIDGIEITDKISTNELCKIAGLVFQYPENQIFEKTVYDEIAFGVRNILSDESEIKKRVEKACLYTGIDAKIMNKSPFCLSGGQKRRVSIASILAMNPKIIILDEPAAGLDPLGKKEIMDNIKMLNEKLGITVIIVSHNIEDIIEYTQRVLVMNNGKLAALGNVREVFKDTKMLEASGILLPDVSKLMRKLNNIVIKMPENVYTVEDAFEVISKSLKR